MLFDRRVVPRLQVGCIQLEDLEADINGLSLFVTNLSLRILFKDFLACSADTLFAYFADVFISVFIGFTVFSSNLRQLNHNKLP